MRSKKNFNYQRGKYYLVIKSHPNNITFYRKDKSAAVDTFHRYNQVGKNIEWLGRWNGKSFEEQNIVSAATA